MAPGEVGLDMAGTASGEAPGRAPVRKSWAPWNVAIAAHDPYPPVIWDWGRMQGVTWAETGEDWRELGHCKRRPCLWHHFWISLPAPGALDSLISPPRAGYCISGMGLWMLVDVGGLAAPML
ncbi:hypothetical protein TARUN_1204 [Trichoderma arundinaceum]|uniref:Uncharacterized protein n=1 Tax=Trichoderma arundinaceum TaxID=490622 RepID=A0A395NY63_TRIAR|nr:hypothetical protein TARUN_1204 [Trichoderma arundinaceum]